jgi:hypothetical protein
MILDANGQPIGRTLTQEDAVQLMIDELQALDATPMEIAFRPFTVMQLAGLLQLALRHPDVSAAHRETAWSFLEAAREYFAEAPTVLTVLDAGDDPTQDVRRGGV